MLPSQKMIPCKISIDILTICNSFSYYTIKIISVVQSMARIIIRVKENYHYKD